MDRLLFITEELAEKAIEEALKKELCLLGALELENNFSPEKVNKLTMEEIDDLGVLPMHIIVLVELPDYKTDLFPSYTMRPSIVAEQDVSITA
jgi:hypothetical protein